MDSYKQHGALQGIKVIEFAGLGPAPFACMLLSDMGADVIRIDKLEGPAMNPLDIVGRGRKTIRLDLKCPETKTQVLELLACADVLVEGFRPGVMERLGLGPEVVREKNSRLVYARMTGWGQSGPLAQAAGHDINYIALSGVLSAIGERGRQPTPPLNLVGDYGGGSLYLVMGILAALLERSQSGLGQVVDAAICDGAVSLMSTNQSHTLRGIYQESRGSNMLDGGAPYYSVYATSDDHFVSLGAIEPKFFALLCEKLELPEVLWSAQNERARWPALREAIAESISKRSRQEWVHLMEGADVCFAPVLTLQEAKEHPHIRARQSFVDVQGVAHTAPAPRFSRTPSSIQVPGEKEVQLDELLSIWRTAV